MDKIKTIVLSNGKLEVKEIENTLENLQSIVGGYIEIPFLGGKFNENKINPIINEEGKYIDGLRPEIALIDGNTKRVLDIVYGNCIFASHDMHGETISLNEEQIEIIMEELKNDVTLTFQDNGKEVVVKALFL